MFADSSGVGGFLSVELAWPTRTIVTTKIKRP